MKILKKILRLITVLLPCFFVFLYSLPAFAEPKPFTVYWRSYSLNGSTPVNDSGFHTDLRNEHTLLVYTAGQYKTLYGYSLDFAVPDNHTSYQNKVLSVEFLGLQYGSPAGTNNSLTTNSSLIYLNASTSTGVKTGRACTITRNSYASVRYSCTVSWSDSSSITNAQLVVGTITNATSSSPAVGVVCGTSISPSCNADIGITNLSYTLSGSNSPVYDQNQTIISQNQTMISQNETIIDQNQQQIDQDHQDREDLQNQQTTNDETASGSQQQAENTGTTLLSAFQSFVNALTNAEPTNCRIDMDMGNLDLGDVDLCSLDPPQPIPTIASIFLILFFVPLSIATATKIINLFRSFQ